MQDAIRPELYIKIAIVILGGFLGVTAAEQLGLATSVMFRGLCAIVEAYLIYWALVYYIARRYFGFSREWAAPLARASRFVAFPPRSPPVRQSEARPMVPVMVSSLVVIFAVWRCFCFRFGATFLSSEPMVAGAWMGLAVKTDGAAVTSGAITDALIGSKALRPTAYRYQPGWIMARDDDGEGLHRCVHWIWAFILAWIWAAKIEPQPGEKVRPREIWERFPKFVLGYVATFADRSRDRAARACAGSERQGGNGARRAYSAGSSL